jgi:hypothetical protein
LTNFTEHAKDWMHIADQKFMDIAVFERIAAEEFDRQRDSIGRLNIEVIEIWNVQKQTAVYMTETFTAFKLELLKNQDTLGQLFDIMLKYQDTTNQQLLEITRSNQGLANLVDSFMVTQFKIYQGAPANRAMTAMWFDNEYVAIVPDKVFPENQFNVSEPEFLGLSHKFLGPPRGVPSPTRTGTRF